MTDLSARRRATSPADVDRQFDELWRAASTDDQAVVRACSMNLVVVGEDDDPELERATTCVRQITETVPGRVVVIGAARKTGDFDVYVTGHCHRGSGGAQVCSEQVTILPTVATLDRVRPNVLQMLVEDMPVCTWWRRPELDLPQLLEPLLGFSDCLVVDSRRVAQPADHLARLAAIGTDGGWHGRLADVAWVRLEPWREAIASFFDSPALRDAALGIDRVRIAAGGVAGAYLAGWLASRLELRREGEDWVRTNGTPLEIVLAAGSAARADDVRSVTIEARHGDESLMLDATRDGPDCLRLTVNTGEPLPVRRMRLPIDDEAALLCGVLQRSGSEAVYRQALRDAARTR